MDLTAPHDSQIVRASGSTKALLLVFCLALITTLGYFVFNQDKYLVTSEEYVTAKSVSKAKVAEQAGATDSKTVACGEEDQQFSLTFGDSWASYKVKELKSNDAVITCYFNLPTDSDETVWTTASTTNFANYASVFAVSVYTPAQFTAASAETNAPAKIYSNNTYVWAWAPAQALPQDLQDAKVSSEVKAIIATFQLAG